MPKTHITTITTHFQTSSLAPYHEMAPTISNVFVHFIMVLFGWLLIYLYFCSKKKKVL